MTSEVGVVMTELLEIGAGAGIRVLPLTADRVSIGRNDDNDLIISHDSTVSRNHAVLEKAEGRWRIRDLRSRNGTYVNGARVTGSAAVTPGDRLKIGNTSVKFVEEAPAISPVLETMQSDAQGLVGPRLTHREEEILRLVGEGCTDAAIAETLTISLKTVHSHLDRIRDKTGARRRADLTRLALTL